MKGKLMGFILTAVIVLVIVGVASRIAFLKKLVFGA